MSIMQWIKFKVVTLEKYFVYIPCLLRYWRKRESAFQIDEVIGR